MSKRFGLLFGLIALLVLAIACGSNEAESVGTGGEGEGHGHEAEGTYVVNASAFAGKSAADWDNAEEIVVEMDEFSFTPDTLTFEAGKPYIVKIVNVGQVKHEFTAEEFFSSVAWRKAESGESEIKAPFFTEIEIFAGKSAELFFVPITPGTYDLVCEIEGHLEAGMAGTITVTGSTPTSPAPVFASIDSGPWVAGGDEIVAAARAANKEWTEVNVTLGEFFFAPGEIHLKVDEPYKLVFDNSGGEVKHEATAPEFFNTVAFRKVEDASGEFKTPAPLEVEVFSEKDTELFLIPTETGSYELVCEIEGHFEAGMHGTIIVE